MKETTVLGIKVSVITKKEILLLVRQCVDEGGKLTFVAINARKVIRAKEDPRIAALLETFDIFLADGASIVKAVDQPVERITGVEADGISMCICASIIASHLSVWIKQRT